MQCLSCATDVSTKMKAALHGNTCPFCGSYIMDPKKAKQYAALVSVLSGTRLTNRDNLDEQIKEKVVEVLTKHFEFQKIDGVETEAGVVVVDSEESTPTPTADAPSPAPEAPARKVGEAAPQGRIPRNLGQVKAKKASTGTIFEQVQNDMYESGEDDSHYPDEDQISPEEVAKYFQDTTPADIREKVEKRLAAARGVQTASSPSENGTGIRRISR